MTQGRDKSAECAKHAVVNCSKEGQQQQVCHQTHLAEAMFWSGRHSIFHSACATVTAQSSSEHSTHQACSEKAFTCCRSITARERPEGSASCHCLACLLHCASSHIQWPVIALTAAPMTVQDTAATSKHVVCNADTRHMSCNITSPTMRSQTAVASMWLEGGGDKVILGGRRGEEGGGGGEKEGKRSRGGKNQKAPCRLLLEKASEVVPHAGK